MSHDCFDTTLLSRKDSVNDDTSARGSTKGIRIAQFLSAWSVAQPTAPISAYLQRVALTGIRPSFKNLLSMVGSATDAWTGYPYHSAAHHLDVMVIAMALTETRPEMREALSFAALLHDYDYQPDLRLAQPYHQERVAAAFAVSMLKMSAAAMGDEPLNLSEGLVNALILSTYPSLRARMAEGHASWSIRLREGNPGVALDLSQSAFEMCCLLSDADIISSVGLPLHWAFERHEALAAELGCISIPPTETVAFFEKVVGDQLLTEDARIHFGAFVETSRRVMLAEARLAISENERRATGAHWLADATELIT